MPRVDLLVVNASELATLRGPARARRRKELRNLAITNDGAVAIRDGLVVATGRSSTLRRRYSATRTLDAENRAVLPGFVDAHTHLPFAGSRAFEIDLKLAGVPYLEILRRGGGIHRTVRDTRQASLADLTRLVRERARTMLAWGTTTAEAKSGYGLDAKNELKQLRAVRDASRRVAIEFVPTLLAAHAVPQEHARDRAGYIRSILDEIIPQVADAHLAEFCDVFLEQDVFTRDETVSILAAGAANGLTPKVHADEFTNQRGAELAATIGCATADHLLRVSRRGITALARAATVAVLLPGVTVTSFLDRYAPARALIDGGAAVALGTDFNPNCHVLTMPTVLQWATQHLRMTPAEAITAATVNAAHALHRPDRGTLVAGQRADFLVLRYESLLDLVYRVGPNPVAETVARGRPENIENT